MDDLTAMKGRGTPVATLIRDKAVTQLLAFADGSFGIRHGAAMAGTWEADQADVCFQTFLAMGGANTGVGAIILRPGNLASSDLLRDVPVGNTPVAHNN